MSGAPSPSAGTAGSGPRVAVDLRALVGSPSGIGFFTLGLLQRLAKGSGSYLGLSHRPISAADELTAAGVDLEHQPAPLGLLWQQLVLPRRLAREPGLDLFWSPLFTLPVVRPLPRDLSSVVTVHDLSPLLLPETHRLKVRLSILPFLEPSLTAARRVVADSRATADDLRRQFPHCAAKVEVVYPGVEARFRPADQETIERVRRSVGSPGGYVFFAGTVEPRKNLGPLLEAWEAVKRDDPGAPDLVLAGPYGWRSRALVRRVRALEPLGLKHLGHVERSRLVELFQAATLFVMPSLYEGFGLPAVEAMACGVPTITSNLSSLPEVVGDAGLRVGVEDGSELAVAIRRLLREPEEARELAARGVERARRFSWTRAATEMEQIFDRCRR